MYRNLAHTKPHIAKIISNGKNLLEQPIHPKSASFD